MEVECLEFNSDNNFDDVKRFVIQNKDKYKFKSLSDSLIIKGIGEKYLKIENNFYSWDEIAKALDDYKNGRIIDEIVLSILSWLFADVNFASSYIPRKFNLNEKFDNVKKEILDHKQYYKTGLISGIGEKNIKITTFNNKDYYIEWNEIEKAVNNIKYSSLDELEEKRFSTSIIKQLFNDNYIQYSDYELELLNEENGKIKLKYYKYCKYGKLSYKVIKEENEDKRLVKEIVSLALQWNNGQLPFNITEDGVNHIILNKSSLVRADLRKNDQYTQRLQKELNENYKVYSIQYPDEYVYHSHNYNNLIKFEKDASKWTVTYSNRNLLEKAFRKEIQSHWMCDITIIKSTEICIINDYDNEGNVFNPDLFTKLYEDFHKKLQ